MKSIAGKTLSYILLWTQFIAALVGVFNAVVPESYQFIPASTGLLLTLIAIPALSISAAALSLDEHNNTASTILEKLQKTHSPGVSAMHESQFYTKWPEQMKAARYIIDITHLGIDVPGRSHVKEQGDYFKKFKRFVKSTPAHVRRVERVTAGKVEWIRDLLKEFDGVNNFSLALYRDPLGDELMPAAISVCRVDNFCAWIIAIVEHQSTTPDRDIEFTDAPTIGLLSDYYQKRLWNRSVPVIQNGIAVPDAEKILTQLLSK